MAGETKSWISVCYIEKNDIKCLKRNAEYALSNVKVNLHDDCAEAYCTITNTD